MFKAFAIVAVLVALLPTEISPVRAETDLYEAVVRVTGQGEENRDAAFAEGLMQVLVKASGDPSLAGDPRAMAMTADAAALVDHFTYRDLMQGIPVHDEQGTRQRPFELTVEFDPVRVDGALASLGRKEWTERPRLVLLLGVHHGGSPYVLASDGARGRDLREALSAAARRYALDVNLPTQGVLTGADLLIDPMQADQNALAPLAAKMGGGVVLAGVLAWDDTAMGWSADWRLQAGKELHSWRVGGVNFDTAFRSGIGGVSQILSDHGSPQ